MSNPSEPARPAHDPQARQLMIVDDEPQVLQALLTLFEKQYMVVIAENGHRGLELLQQGFTPQVILTDNNMPGIHGVEFLSEASKYVPDAIKVVMSGMAEIKEVIAAVQKGQVFMYLTKPWQVADLLQNIRLCFSHYNDVMEKKQLRQELQKRDELVDALKEEIHTLNRRVKAVDHEVYTDLIDTATALGGLLGSTQFYYCRNHAIDCAELAHDLGKHLGIDGDKLLQLEMAGLLHDIGKVGLPYEVQLNDPLTLSPADREIYESHVARAVELLKPIERLEKVAAIVGQHHEHVDGSGFPQKLSGYQVTREAQVVGIVDLYHNAVYRIEGGNTPTDAEVAARQIAAGKLIQSRSSWFDKAVVEGFFALARSGSVEGLRLE